MYLFIYLFPIIFYFAPEQAQSCCSIQNKNGDHGPQLAFLVGIKTWKTSAMCVSLHSCQDTWKLNGSKLLTSDRLRCAGNCEYSRYHVHTGWSTFLSLPPSSRGHLISSGEAGAHLSDDVLTSSSCKGVGGALKKLANRTVLFQYEL